MKITTAVGSFVIAGLFNASPSLAQLTVSTGAEYTSGTYGDPEKTTAWTMPFLIKYETGPLTLRLNMPWTRVSGTANVETGQTLSEQVRGNGTSECLRGGGNGGVDDNPPAGCVTSSGTTTTTRRTQSGFGDLVGSATYTVLDAESAPIGLDLGVKIKFATAKKEDCLITTGKTDYSLQADIYRSFGAWSPYLTIGWTKKGDPDRRDAECNSLGDKTNYRNPWFAGVGTSYRISDVTSVGLSYDFRERLLSNSDPVSEASAYINFKMSGGLRLQIYGLTGFTDSSPDWGAGATIGYSF